MNAEGKPWISLERRRLREHLIEGEGNEPKDDQRLKYRKKRRDDQINEGKFNWGSKVETNRQRGRMSTAAGIVERNTERSSCDPEKGL